MDDTQITPALSAEAWAEIKDGDESYVLNRIEVAIYHRDLGGLPAVLAIANHALPDTDPRKIRRADVARLRAGASHMTEEGWRGDDERDFVIALAAKLAAILPE